MIGWKRNRCSQQRLLDKNVFVVWFYIVPATQSIFSFRSLHQHLLPAQEFIVPSPLPLPAHALQNPILISISPDNSIEPFL